MPTLTRNDYTVAWISVLDEELAIAMAMLDEIHSPLPQHPKEANCYTLGRIGEHNVVIACSPSGRPGTASAATVAARIPYGFPSIKFFLMVGIGGGVPSAKNDVRLGDVVVSKPGRTSGGVVQYDFGKTVKSGRLVQTDSLNAPPTALLTTVNTLRATHRLQNRGVANYFSSLSSTMQEEYAYPGSKRDRLFEALYDHVGPGPGCDNCDAKMLKTRSDRKSTESVVHYGTVASGNKVMTDAITRDQLADAFNVVCFEMEAAGLMNDFPCLVIRGISDYADSHKNEGWRNYAAAEAASYAKELLSVIPKDQVLQDVSVQHPAPPTAAAPPVTSTSDPAQPPSEPSIANNTPRTINPSDTETPDPGAGPTSSPERATPSSFYVFSSFYPANAAALGRLVLDTKKPWEDFCPVHPPLGKEDVAIFNNGHEVRNILKRAKGSKVYDKLTKLFSCFTGYGIAAEGSIPTTEKRYVLVNSGKWLRKLCDEPGTKEWLETTIKYNWKVYMIVGLCTQDKSSVEVNDLEQRFEELSTEGEDRTAGSNEVIVAIQYRKVHFSWFTGLKDPAAASNIGCGRWVPFNISGRDPVTGEEEIVEANLQCAIDQEDIDDGEVLFTDDLVISV